MKQTSKLIGIRTFASFVLLGALASPASANTKDFPAGSLIIPATSVYQTDCGAVSMYGLVYNILRANAWLEADPGYGPIEIYYSYNTTKSSPNRCTPTNLHSGYAPSADASWVDGCDFSISNSAGTNNIVSLVNNKVANADSTITTINTNGKAGVYPTYNIAQPITAAAGVTTVRYSGGSFVIDASDAATFIGLLRGSIPARDNGVLINYAPWRLSDASGNPDACDFDAAWGTSTQGGWVNIHRSLVSFTAPVPKLFNANPPRLALLALDITGDGMGTGTLSNNILQGYLSRAGLTFSGANGCPTNSPHRLTTATCPNGDTSGEIFDTFDFADVYNNRLDSTKYKMFWAPHWELSTGTGNSYEKAVVGKIAAFLEGTTGVMGECASIETFEGSQNMTADTAAATRAKFQTCRDDATGACSTTTIPTRGFDVNSGGGYNSDPNGVLRNCTDVDMAGGSNCFYISYPADPFVQIGDYRWFADSGVVADYLPRDATTPPNIYKPGVLPLLSGVTNLDVSQLSTPAAARASGLLTGDFVSRNQKDNTSTKGNILYLGGHDLTESVAGTKVALQTLLQLGTPEVTSFTTEISRAMPIIALLGTGQSLVQGTYESVQPIAGTPQTLLNDTQADTFEFPFVIGHLRGFTNVTTTATAFDTLGATGWDATTLIPTATYAGCSTSFTATCRTVFTNLDANCNKAGTPCTKTILSDSTAEAIGDVINASLTAASQTKLVRRILEGIPDPSLPNQYKARLGGIDRSTVAVIPQSSLAGVGARPTMIYVGASDGMIHAICGEAIAPCDTVGRELWAFLPRNQLTAVPLNETRIDASVRVQDMYGDFDGTGKSFRTVLVFQSAPSLSTATPATYALDVTFPGAPEILWEHGTTGKGLAVTMGKINANQNAAFVQTNMGSTAGTEVRAIDAETGLAIWTKQLPMPAARTVSRPVPATGIPGGAVAVDLTDSGYMTDVVFGTLYGQIFRLSALDGTNPYEPDPLFQFTQDLKPFGAAPALFSSGQVYAVLASGGYVDYNTSTEPLWTSSSTMQQAVAVAINAPPTAVVLDETTTPNANGLRFAYDLTTGQLGYSQAQVIGDQIFLTTDSSDVNATTYGTGGDTGMAHRIDLMGDNDTVVAISGGAASVGRNGTTTYAASGDKAQQLSTLGATSADPTEGVNGGAQTKITRRLWLRTL
jgi:type IV pilus assembly protein PilY1